MNTNLDEFYDAFPILFKYKNTYVVSYCIKKTTILETGKVIEKYHGYTPFQDKESALTFNWERRY